MVERAPPPRHGAHPHGPPQSARANRDIYFWILPRLFAFLREEKPTQHKTNREEPSGDRGGSSRRRRPRPSKLKVTAQARCIRPKCIPPAQNAAELAALTPSLIRLPLPLRVAYLRSCRHARIERMSCQWQVVRQASNRPSMFSATPLSTPPRERCPRALRVNSRRHCSSA